MKATVDYMAKIDEKDFAEWREKDGVFNGRILFQQWVNHLSDKDNFKEFYENIDPKYFERTKDDFTQYKIRNLDKKNWKQFIKNCREVGLFANDLVNVLIKKYNKEGYCVIRTVKI